MKNQIRRIFRMVKEASKLTVIILIILGAIVGFICLSKILTDCLGSYGIAISAVIAIFILSMLTVWALEVDKEDGNASSN